MTRSRQGADLSVDRERALPRSNHLNLRRGCDHRLTEPVAMRSVGAGRFRMDVLRLMMSSAHSERWLGQTFCERLNSDWSLAQFLQEGEIFGIGPVTRSRYSRSKAKIRSTSSAIS